MNHDHSVAPWDWSDLDLKRGSYIFVQSNIIYTYSSPQILSIGESSQTFAFVFWFILVAFETTKDSISETGWNVSIQNGPILAWKASNWNEPYAIMNLHGTHGTYHEANQLTNHIYIFYLSWTPKYIQCFLWGNKVGHWLGQVILFADLLVGWLEKVPKI